MALYRHSSLALPEQVLRIDSHLPRDVACAEVISVYYLAAVP